MAIYFCEPEEMEEVLAEHLAEKDFEETYWVVEDYEPTPKDVLSWLMAEGPMPIIEQFFKDCDKYELSDILDEISRKYHREIVDYVA